MLLIHKLLDHASFSFLPLSSFGPVLCLLSPPAGEHVQGATVTHSGFHWQVLVRGPHIKLVWGRGEGEGWSSLWTSIIVLFLSSNALGSAIIAWGESVPENEVHTHLKVSSFNEATYEKQSQDRWIPLNIPLFSLDLSIHVYHFFVPAVDCEMSLVDHNWHFYLKK